MSESDLPGDDESPDIELPPDAEDDAPEGYSFEAQPDPEATPQDMPGGEGDGSDLSAKFADIDTQLAVIWANLFNNDESGTGTGGGDVHAAVLVLNDTVAGTDGSVSCAYTYDVYQKDGTTLVDEDVTPVNDRLVNTEYNAANRGIYWIAADNTTVYLYAFETKKNAGLSGEQQVGPVTWDTNTGKLEQTKMLMADGRIISATATKVPIDTATGSCA